MNTVNHPSMQYFVDFCINNCLTQVISEPTHNDGNILDIVLCNISAYNCLISSCVECPFTVTCDHLLISLTFKNNHISINTRKKLVRLYKKGDYVKINNVLLYQDWSFLYNDSPFQERYDKFIEILVNVISTYIPSKLYLSNKSMKLPRHLNTLLKSKLKTYKLLKVGKVSKLLYKKKVKTTKWQSKA